jgi:hypothetical protein
MRAATLLLLALPRVALATWAIIAIDIRTGQVIIASATCVRQVSFSQRQPNGARDLMDAQAVIVPGIGVAACQAGVDNTRENQMLVYNELRTAGLLRQRPVVQDDAVNAATSASGDATELDALAAERKASMLLRMLVATLVRSGRLRTERGLTYRELSARANFDDAQQRESFRRVASLAERTVYGGRELTADEVEPVVAIARALDAQLRGAPA